MLSTINDSVADIIILLKFVGARQVNNNHAVSITNYNLKLIRHNKIVTTGSVIETEQAKSQLFSMAIAMSVDVYTGF